MNENQEMQTIASNQQELTLPNDAYCPYQDEELEQLIHCFGDEELDQVIRCYAALVDHRNSDTFLMKIALSSPYPLSLLSGNRMRRRIEFIEDKILPSGFGSSLREAMAVELLGDYEGEISLERFLKGVADCCVRDPKNQLRLIWDCCSVDDRERKDPGLDPAKIVDLCYRLSIAAEVIITRNFDMDAITAKLESEHDFACSSLEQSLTEAGSNGVVNKQNFFDWAQTCAPHISSTMSSFVDKLLFHTTKMSTTRLNYVPFKFPTSSA